MKLSKKIIIYLTKYSIIEFECKKIKERGIQDTYEEEKR